jgi:S-disulfanyl-L-cysteine oxidoreductase SoxD
MSRLLCVLTLLALVAVVANGPSMAQVAAVSNASGAEARQAQNVAASRRLGIGREAKPEEIAGWDIDIRPDGQGLSVGKGTVKDGETLYSQRCAGCHGDFGEGLGRWPALAGGAGILTGERPLKTIGSFWPYASSVIDYVRRAQPFGNAQSLSNVELYAVVAYVLFLNDIVDEKFVLTNETIRTIRMPNESAFYDDDREQSEQAFWNRKPCMTNCKTNVKITGHARALDATPTATPPRHRDE